MNMDAEDYYNYPRGHQPPIITPEQNRIMEASFPPLEVKTLEGKKRLHWFQWVTYAIVIMTCFAVLYGMLETWLMVQSIQDAAERFANGLGDL
jgi:hypothetical protein